MRLGWEEKGELGCAAEPGTNVIFDFLDLQNESLTPTLPRASSPFSPPLALYVVVLALGLPA